jgi:polysaccharide pyruvyl transferase WcaK-like protein
MSRTPHTPRDSFAGPRPSADAPGRSLRLCIFGAPPGTGNLGVTALNHALLQGIARRVEQPSITVFDDRRGVRDATVSVSDRQLPFRLCGAIPTRRIHLRDSLWRIRLSGRLGGLGNPAVRALRAADAVFDVTGGDSFTDLYGPRRFRWATLDKLIALEQGPPLVLTPQTIGPFGDERTTRTAQRILRAAAMIWARDARSYALLRQLLGADFDPARHRFGVDLAFGLEARPPEQPLPLPVSAWLAPEAERPVIGFNVSGLLCNDAPTSQRRFGLRADYREAVIGFLRRILRETDANVLLTPHVVTRPGHHEHDPDACISIIHSLGDDHAARLALAPLTQDPTEMKWIIARTDWFCATRMHAGIAALSSGVPTAAIAYSHKTRGVYDTCGQGRHVADPRESTTEEVIDRLWQSWTQRAAAAVELRHRLPLVLRQAGDQMDAMLACAGLPARDAPGLRRAA